MFSRINQTSYRVWALLAWLLAFLRAMAVCEQANLDRFNAAVCVGSCAVYRRVAVEPFGGVAPIEHSEDMYTGYKMTEIGYKV